MNAYICDLSGFCSMSGVLMVCIGLYCMFIYEFDLSMISKFGHWVATEW